MLETNAPKPILFASCILMVIHTSVFFFVVELYWKNIMQPRWMANRANGRTRVDKAMVEVEMKSEDRWENLGTWD